MRRSACATVSSQPMPPTLASNLVRSEGPDRLASAEGPSNTSNSRIKTQQETRDRDEGATRARRGTAGEAGSSVSTKQGKAGGCSHPRASRELQGQGAAYSTRVPREGPNARASVRPPDIEGARCSHRERRTGIKGNDRWTRGGGRRRADAGAWTHRDRGEIVQCTCRG